MIFLNLITTKKLTINQVILLRNIQIFSGYMAKTWCVGGRHYSESVNQNKYEKGKPQD